MANEGFKRKLTAILSADVEGYSRLKGVRYMYGCFHTAICITIYGCLSIKNSMLHDTVISAYAGFRKILLLNRYYSPTLYGTLP